MMVNFSPYAVEKAPRAISFGAPRRANRVYPTRQPRQTSSEVIETAADDNA